MKSSLHRSIASWLPGSALALATAATATVGITTVIAPALAAAFGQQEVDQSRFIAVAAPRGSNAHQLLILEQVSDARPCYSVSGSNPAIVDPLLLDFNFTGICGRSTDSNGYSIRVNGEDLGLQYSLRVVERNNDLILIGAPSNRSNPEISIARANGTTRDFARLDLNQGWRFTKRTFDGRTLGHVYLTFEGTLPTPSPSPSPSPSPTPSPSPGPSPSPAPSPTPSPAPSTVNFQDIRGDVYAQEIQQAAQAGFVSGFADNTFRPQEPVTREQLVSLVLDALRQVPNANLNIPTSVRTNPYRDVSASRWSAAKIQFARDNNIVSGYQDGSFRPTQPVTRAEMMAVLRRAAEYGNTLRGRPAQLQPAQEPRTFSDTSGHWANSLIQEMSAYCNVASPVNEQGTAFQPNSPARRNYAAAATLRMLNCVRR
jgi:hypothetical protein